MKIYNTGNDEWTHGSAMDHDYGIHCGPCPVCGSRTVEYPSKAWRCLNGACINYQLTLDLRKDIFWWNTDINVCLDGDQWCANRDGFINLQESLAGFGDTPQQAVDALLRDEGIHQADDLHTEYVKAESEWNRPQGTGFVMGVDWGQGAKPAIRFVCNEVVRIAGKNLVRRFHNDIYNRYWIFPFWCSYRVCHWPFGASNL